MSTKEEIRKRYGTLCAHLGEATYRLSQMEKEVESLVEQLEELNNDFAKLPQEEKQAEVPVEASDVPKA